MLTSDDKGLAPMDIDRVQDNRKKGQRKTKDGKSRGKAKDNKGGKGKGAGGKKGHESWNKEGWGKGKGEKQGSWKDGKGKGKVCYTRGKPGHVAKDCWRVRQVAENPQSSTPSTGGGTSNAAQDDANANRASAKRVSQISMESVSQTSLDPFVVDLRGLDEDSGVIRAVQFFFMEEDEPRELSDEVTLSVSAVRAMTKVTYGVRSIGFQ